MNDTKGQQQPRRPIERGGARSLVLAAMGILLAMGLLPWALLGLAVEVAAVVVGVRALRRASTRGGTAPGAVAGVVGGVMGTGFCLLFLAFLALFHTEYHSFTSCVDRALVESEQHRCTTAFQDAVLNRAAHLRG